MTTTAAQLRTVRNLQYAREFVAAALERQQAYKVKLIALLKWVHDQAKRIISRCKLAELAKQAAKNIITTLPIPVKPIQPQHQNGAASMIWCNTCCALVPGTNGKCSRCGTKQIADPDVLKALAEKSRVAAMCERSRETAIRLGNTNATVKTTTGYQL